MLTGQFDIDYLTSNFGVYDGIHYFSYCWSKLSFRYDYEEKLLERVIRTDLQMQQALEKLDTAMEKVDGE